MLRLVETIEKIRKIRLSGDWSSTYKKKKKKKKTKKKTKKR